ncbi:hypothetical protein CEXT_257351 [Caerostris extrusa]|uniref:Uncharacterized protein n=1 Tax=Caerostris extrusa TaxID=172846 RepID=A0AAV4RJL9_CAEEX|nr:hypothetical protein CEXT_257351 [Caerostris extrusa]
MGHPKGEVRIDSTRPTGGHTTDDERCRHSNPKHQYKRNPTGAQTQVSSYGPVPNPMVGPDQKQFIEKPKYIHSGTIHSQPTGAVEILEYIYN